MKKRLYVENFAPTTTRETLRDLFQQSGMVESVTFPEHSLDVTTNHAFVVMTNAIDARTAIRTLNNSQWNGYRLTVTSAGEVQSSAGFTGGSPWRQQK